ncbi:MAG: hypothetical protein QXG81_07915 [Ignisphaera sp.]
MLCVTKGLAILIATTIVMLIVAILIIVGYIGLVMHLLRLGSTLNSKMFLITAIILIITPITRLIAGFVLRIMSIPWVLEFEAWLLT